MSPRPRDLHDPQSPRFGEDRPIHQPPPSDLKVVTSAGLFGGEREIGIEHAGSLYRLKITRQGKLILNK